MHVEVVAVLTSIGYIFICYEMSLFGFGPAEGIVHCGHDFDMLIGGGRSPSLSPFLGGFHRLYLLILEKRTLLQRLKSAKPAQIPKILSQARLLLEELNDLEIQIENTTFLRPDRSEDHLIKAKHLLTAYATNIRLTKITQPDDSIARAEMQLKVTKAVNILRADDVRERDHPLLTWPLLALACAALQPADFAVITSVIAQVIPVTEPSGAETLRNASSLLTRFRAGYGNCREQFKDFKDTTDFLLEPQLLLTAEQRHLYALE